MKRDYLVFCSTNHGKATPELYGEGRLYDVCCHDYAHWGDEDLGCVRQSEYYFPYPNREKLEVAAEIIPALPSYKYYAFLDDDLTVTTAELNRLFQVGEGLGLDLYQPALTQNSYSSHFHLKTQYKQVRQVPFVEIMSPWFSARALKECLFSFNLTLSSWGIDCYIWPQKYQGYVIDSIPIGHYREPSRRARIFRNGLTCLQELWIMTKIYGPTEDTSYPPGFPPSARQSLQEI